jgi:hypothetical protein
VGPNVFEHFYLFLAAMRTVTALGFVFNRVLFARDGAFLGRFEDDIYRDARGRIVAFEREATGGPLLPVPEPPPVAPLPELRPPVPAWGQVPTAPGHAIDALVRPRVGRPRERLTRRLRPGKRDGCRPAG